MIFTMAKIINRERLRAKLRALPDNLRKNIVDPMEKSAQNIVDLAINLCPERTGALRNSIDWNWGDPPAGSSFGSKAPTVSKSVFRISVYAGNDRAFYARWVEFGTQPSVKGSKVSAPSRGKGKKRVAYRTHPGTRAQPFFYPAYRASRTKVRSAIARGVNKALKATANASN